MREQQRMRPIFEKVRVSETLLNMIDTNGDMKWKK
jgi:hypothetical protein